jgi:hypothetical protein
MGNLFTVEVGNIFTVPMGNVLTERVGKVLVFYKTTNRYAEVDLEMKAKALATCAVTSSRKSADGARVWRRNPDLMNFLASL